MRANGGILIIAMSVMGLGASYGSSDPAPAEESCLSAPNARPPQGSHWFYHTDRANQRKCWYLRQQGETAEANTTASRPRAPSSKTAADFSEFRRLQTTPKNSAELRGSLTQKDTQDGEAGRQTVTAPLVSPEPPSPVSANNMVRPNPSTSDHTGTVAEAASSSSVVGTAQGPVVENAPEEGARQTEDLRASVANADEEDAEKDIRADGNDDTEPAASRSKPSFGVLFAGAIGLMIVGIFVRRMVKMKLRLPRKVYLERQEAVSTASTARRVMMPEFRTPLNGPTSDPVNVGRDGGSIQALRKLLCGS
jgi:hypothetical protein